MTRSAPFLLFSFANHTADDHEAIVFTSSPRDPEAQMRHSVTVAAGEVGKLRLPAIIDIASVEWPHGIIAVRLVATGRPR